MTSLVRVVQRAVPKEWEEQLAALSPQTNRFTWLKLIWEAGYPWEPVERYMIYQMVPAHAVDVTILEQLEHPLPPSKMGNYYDTVLQEFVRNPDCLITERAYFLFKETGCWGRPYWVIQGTKGGHKRWFSTIEKKLLKLAGLPNEPPAPGDLPYAEFSQLTLDKLFEHDLLTSAHGSLKRTKGVLGNDAYRERLSDQERAFREGLIAWLKDQVQEIAPDVHKGLVGADAPRSRVDPKAIEELQEETERVFIETGSIGSRKHINISHN